MILIAHRGNINGSIPEKENHPNYIKNTILEGYQVEVDVWYKSDGWWSGHDVPQYKFPEELLKDCWCHIKNKDALVHGKKMNLPKYFWHENDAYTLTSNGYIWTHSNAPAIDNAILVMPEYRNEPIKHSYDGICSDYIMKYKV